jgi:hypothetical protein
MPILNRLLSKSSTNRGELEKLLRESGITDGEVDWAYNYNPNVPYMILNLGNLAIGGTHWVAVDNVKKIYFDPLGASPPTYIPRDYQYNNLQIQNFNFGHCGQYCVLFLVYSKADELDRFYNLFTISNL